MVSRIN